MPESLRSRLLGSVQGQLQLSTILVLFAGFTAASCASLWIDQRNLSRERSRALDERSETIHLCIAQLTKTPGFATTPSSLQQLPLCLQGRSDAHAAFSLQLSDGALIQPSPSSRYVPNATAAALIASLKGQPTAHTDLTLKHGGTYFLLHRHRPNQPGPQLIAIENLSERSRYLSANLLAFVLIWLVLLLLTAVAVSVVVNQTMGPLRYLSNMADGIDADTLPSTRLSLQRAPREIAQLANSYNQLLDRLSEAANNQKQFVSAVSHELRNPLTLISGYVRRLLRRGDNLREDQHQALAIVDAETQRIIRLISQLLDLSRSDAAGGLPLETRAMQLSTELEQVSELARTSLSRPLELNLPSDGDERAACVQANPDRFRQVVLNLIENADKYSPASSPIQLSLYRRGEAMVVDVADQGIGIPADELDHVFERFYRARNTTAVEGSGIGLAVAKLIVESMGGTISVASVLGQGTHFHVAFPLSPAALATPTP